MEDNNDQQLNQQPADQNQDGVQPTPGADSASQDSAQTADANNSEARNVPLEPTDTQSAENSFNPEPDQVVQEPQEGLTSPGVGDQAAAPASYDQPQPVTDQAPVDSGNYNDPSAVSGDVAAATQPSEQPTAPDVSLGSSSDQAAAASSFEQPVGGTNPAEPAPQSQPTEFDQTGPIPTTTPEPSAEAQPATPTEPNQPDPAQAGDPSAFTQEPPSANPPLPTNDEAGGQPPANPDQPAQP